MPESLWRIAERRANELHFGGNVSAYLAHLVRQEAGVTESARFEQGRGGSITQQDSAVEKAASELLNKAVQDVESEDGK